MAIITKKTGKNDIPIPSVLMKSYPMAGTNTLTVHTLLLKKKLKKQKL